MEDDNAPTGTPCHQCKILVVDDDDSSRFLLREFLGRDGHAIIEAENGSQGLEVYASEKPDLIITDVVMPIMEGITFIRELRNKDKDTPIIVMTSDIHGRAKEFFDISSQVGSAIGMEKPINQEKLRAALSEAMVFVNQRKNATA